MSGPGDAPEIAYWHLHVGPDGISRQVRRTMTAFEREAIAPGAAPQWLGPPDHGIRTIRFTVLPAGWVGAWHENPHPQWIVPLSGRWFVEAMDGTRREFGPGEIGLGQDQGCTERDGKRGHRSGTVGAEPCALLIVQYDDGAAVPGAAEA